jgi:hypothetical protein
LLGVIFLVGKKGEVLKAADRCGTTQPILDGVDHLRWTSLILPTELEREEEQGIRGELKCVHFFKFIIWPLDRKKN